MEKNKKGRTGERKGKRRREKEKERIRRGARDT